VSGIPFLTALFLMSRSPGTGKTVTIIEAMQQILAADDKARILACAPSNSAADIIAERLLGLGKSQLFRLNAPSRPKRLLLRSLEPVSCMNEEEGFYVPRKEVLMKFSVIVSTCVSAAVPYALGFPPGHFSHVFVDESGQACEPEVLIGIKTMANNKTNLILSGDPKQLGPIVRSNLGLKLRLGASLLDRVMGLPLYDQTTMQGKT
jgi:helicase MOV-10